jgi:hypothetical protein
MSHEIRMGKGTLSIRLTSGPLYTEEVIVSCAHRSVRREQWTPPGSPMTIDSAMRLAILEHLGGGCDCAGELGREFSVDDSTAPVRPRAPFPN